MNLLKLLKIKYPIIQGGMIWASGANLVSAVSNAGGLGLLGAGSMTPEVLEIQIKKTLRQTQKPFGINIPILYKNAKAHIDIAIKYNIKIYFLSAGSPHKFTKYIKDRVENAIVIHVTSSPELAIKCEAAGVDAIVAEGFEAGGHNGKDEITTMVLTPQIVNCVKIPVIAAGGIASGSQILAALSLGASAVQIGSLFASSIESNSHINFKNKIIESKSKDTRIYFKNHIPVRLIANDFTKNLESLRSIDEKIKLLGSGRAKLGMHFGDILEGELEIGQVCGQINKIKSIDDIFSDLISNYLFHSKKLEHFKTIFVS